MLINYYHVHSFGLPSVMEWEVERDRGGEGGGGEGGRLKQGGGGVG